MTCDNCGYISSRLTEVANIVSFEKLYAHVCETGAFLGFKYWHCKPIAPIIPSSKKYGIGNHPTEFKNSYLESSLIGSDPVFKYAITTSNPFVLHEKADLFDQSKNIVWPIAERVGIRDALVIPIHGANYYCGVFIWASGEILELCQQEIILLGHYSVSAHNACEAFLGEGFRYKEVGVKLSPRVQEIMELILQGKTNYEIGVILGLSENTIKFHVKKTCENLNVNSRIQAAVKCLYNQ